MWRKQTAVVAPELAPGRPEGRVLTWRQLLASHREVWPWIVYILLAVLALFVSTGPLRGL